MKGLSVPSAGMFICVAGINMNSVVINHMIDDGMAKWFLMSRIMQHLLITERTIQSKKTTTVTLSIIKSNCDRSPKAVDCPEVTTK